MNKVVPHKYVQLQQPYLCYLYAGIVGVSTIDFLLRTLGITQLFINLLVCSATVKLLLCAEINR